MLSQGFSLVFPIWIVFLFQDSLCLCDRPSWARVGWEILPEELEQLKLGIQLQPSCLPYPLDQMSHFFSILEISKGCLKVLYGSCGVILFLIGGLCVYCLWSNCRRSQSKGAVQTSSASVATEFHSECTCNVNEMLHRLVTNTSIMMNYLEHVRHHHSKEARHQKLNKKRKKEEIADEEIFPICPHNHSSSMDTVMQEV